MAWTRGVPNCTRFQQREGAPRLTVVYRRPWAPCRTADERRSRLIPWFASTVAVTVPGGARSETARGPSGRDDLRALLNHRPPLGEQPGGCSAPMGAARPPSPLDDALRRRRPDPAPRPGVQPCPPPARSCSSPGPAAASAGPSPTAWRPRATTSSPPRAAPTGSTRSRPGPLTCPAPPFPATLDVTDRGVVRALVDWIVAEALAVAATTELAQPALLPYLAAYAVTNLGAFAVVAELPQTRTIDDYRGAARRHPVLVAALVVCLLGPVGTRRRRYSSAS